MSQSVQSAQSRQSQAPRRTRRASAAASAQSAAPLGSLTQPGARDGVCCSACGSDCVTRLAMTLTDGTPVSFTSCHRCEHRTWTDPAGAPLPRNLVLDKARKLT